MNPHRKISTRWLIFAVLAVGYILVYFHRLCTAVVAVDMMRDLAAGATLIGVLASAYFYPYALMQLPAGLLADSLGPRRTITIFFLVAGIGSAVMGFAQTAAVAIAGRLLVGVGVAMLFVPTLKILASWFTPREFASTTGILIAMGGVGSLTAAAPLAFASARIGWRMSFLAVAALTFFSAALIWLIVRDRPGEGSAAHARVAEHQGGEFIGLKKSIGMVLRGRRFWPLASWFFFTSAIFFAYGGLWGGPYLVQVHGMDRTQAGNVLSMIAVGMIAGSPLHSLLSQHLFRARKPVIILSSAVTLVLTAAFAFFTDSLPVPALYLLTFGMGFFTNAIVVIGFTVAKEMFPLSIAGTATGLVNFFPFMGGAVFQPVLGYLLDLQGKAGGDYTVTGYRHAFLALFFCAVAGLISAFFIRETMGDDATVR
jgi:sugar phosphate permease